MDWLFSDRSEAGFRLAQVLHRMQLPAPVVLALPRGGVPVAIPVAQVLGAPLDLMLVRKIGAPIQPEVAVAAVGNNAGAIIEINDRMMTDTGTPAAYVYAQVSTELLEIERRRLLYLNNRPALPVQHRTAILVDDGMATGTTVRAALRVLRDRRPQRIVLALPVAPASELAGVKPLVDDVVCLAALDDFGAVGMYYRHFDQVSDEEVVAMMKPFL